MSGGSMNYAKRKRQSQVRSRGGEPKNGDTPRRADFQPVMLGWHKWRTRYPEDFPVTVTPLSDRG